MLSDSTKESNDKMSLRNIMSSIFCTLLVACALYIVELYHIEEFFEFKKILIVAIGAFVVQFLLPSKYKILAFIMAGLTALVIFFSPKDALIVLVGIIFIGFIGSLRINYWIKITLLTIIGVFLALSRSHVIPSVIPDKVITVLAGIFMFRILIYIYTLNHEKNEENRSMQFSYFFMFPNLVMPFFPIVDYKNFVNGAKSGHTLLAYNRGANLILRGLIQILFYRIFYSYFIPSIGDVDNVLSLSQFIFFTYLTTLRLSGILHFAVGVLCLFGFNLPDIFYNFYLASGFDDYWRRLNIYWKDFIVKVFYYPVFFKIRKIGMVRATMITTIFIFIINWVLHNYQLFWITGTWTFKWTDFIFWMIFGALVTITTYLQLRNTKTKNNKSRTPIVRTLKICLTFLTISIMWTFWQSPTVSGWIQFMSYGLQGSISSYLTLAGIIIGGFVILYTLIWKFDIDKYAKDLRHFPVWEKYFNLAMVIIFSVLSLQWTQHYSESNLHFSLNKILRLQPNQNDEDRKFDGYYENILDGESNANLLQKIEEIDEFMDQKREVSGKQKDDEWVLFYHSRIVEDAGNIEFKKLKPLSEINFKGSDFRTNSWGMRDKAYLLEKSENTVRIALVGASLEMGSGVTNEQVFEYLCEEKLNSNNSGNENYEILNFSVGGRNLIQFPYTIEHEILKFKPDYIVVFNHELEWNSIVKTIAQLAPQMDIINRDNPWLYRLLTQLKITEQSQPQEIRQKLRDYKQMIFENEYQQIVKMCRDHDIKPIWMNIPSVLESRVNPPYEDAVMWAQKAGLECYNLAGWYDGYDTENLRIASGDNHPNARGHELISIPFCNAIQTILEKGK